MPAQHLTYFLCLLVKQQSKPYESHSHTTTGESLACQGHGVEQKQTESVPRRRPVKQQKQSEVLKLLLLSSQYHHDFTGAACLVTHFYLNGPWIKLAWHPVLNPNTMSFKRQNKKP